MLRWMLFIIVAWSLPATGKPRCDLVEWFVKGKVYLHTLDRRVSLNQIISLGNLSLAERRAFFMELKTIGVYVDLLDTDNQQFEQGRIVAVGKPEPQLNGNKFIKFENGTGVHAIDEVPWVILRGFRDSKHPEGRPELLPINLAVEKKLSGLGPTWLSKIEKKSLGLIDAQSLLTESRWKEHAKGAIVLGIGISPYTELSSALGMMEYEEAYKKFDIEQELEGYEDSPSAPTHTDLFMDRVQHQKIVFLIPRRFLQYDVTIIESDFGDKDITKREFKWLMDRPDNSNVLFVMGAYDFIPDGNLGRAEEKDVKQVLKNPGRNSASAAP